MTVTPGEKFLRRASTERRNWRERIAGEGMSRRERTSVRIPGE